MIRRFTNVRGLILLLIVAAGVGCSGKEAPSASPSSDRRELSRREMIERPTPLREEIDQVAPIRDRVLKNSSR